MKTRLARFCQTAFPDGRPPSTEEVFRYVDEGRHDSLMEEYLQQRPQFKVLLNLLDDLPADIHQRIARNAYFRFEARGGEHGWDMDDWLEAEAEILKEVTVKMNSPERARETRKVPAFV